MTTPDASNLNSTAAAASFTVNGNASATKIKDAFSAIAAYLESAPNKDGARANAFYAAQKYNELVAATNAFAA
jgi:hypothetical protein